MPAVLQFLWCRTDPAVEASVGLAAVSVCAAFMTQLRAVRLLAGAGLIELGVQHLAAKHARQQGLKLI